MTSKQPSNAAGGSPVDESADRGRREVLRRVAAGALAPLAAVPLVGGAQDVLVYPPLPGTIRPFPDGCGSGRLVDPRQDATAPFLDPFNDIKAVFDAGVSLIPGIGGPLRIFMDLFWPSDQPDMAAMLLARVQSLIDTAIQKTVLDGLANQLGQPAGATTPATGLNGALAIYASQVKAFNENASAENRDTVKNGAMTLHTVFTGMAGSFAPATEPFADWRPQVLPYFAQFANLHLVFLRDLVWHGPAKGAGGKPGYGFDDGGPGSTMDQFRQYFHDTRAQYVAYATQQLSAIATDLENHYQSQRSNYEDDSPPMLEEYIEVATGAWSAKKKQNVTNSQMIHLVQDYRDLWQVMDDPGGGRVRLTRELYYGPYGAPDLQDIGLPGDGSGSPPDVPSPPASPESPLTYVAASTGAHITQGGRNFNFPSAVTTFRAGDPVNLPPYNSYGISLAEQWGGPIVGITVVTGHYASRTSNPFSNFDNTAGYLVSKLQFTQKNGFVSATTGANGTGWEMKGYQTEVVDVPSGHMLSGVFVPSTVYEFYRSLGKTPTNLTYQSVGSITFGIRMIDPDLPLTLPVIESLYVTNEALSLDDVHQAWLQSHQRKGAAVTADGAAALRAEIDAAWDRNLWDEQRRIFWLRVEAAARAAAH